MRVFLSLTDWTIMISNPLADQMKWEKKTNELLEFRHLWFVAKDELHDLYWNRLWNADAEGKKLLLAKKTMEIRLSRLISNNEDQLETSIYKNIWIWEFIHLQIVRIWEWWYWKEIYEMEFFKRFSSKFTWEKERNFVGIVQTLDK